MAYVALGANLGQPARQLAQAAEELARLGRLLGRSSLYRTEPVGGPPGQPAYLNAVVRLETERPYEDPRSLLKELLGIEGRLGRQRRERWGPRTIDLDLLDLGGRIFVGASVDDPDDRLPALRLPHPRLPERAFVLAPLAELDPEWRHPTLGLRAEELLQYVDQGGVDRLAGEW